MRLKSAGSNVLLLANYLGDRHADRYSEVVQSDQGLWVHPAGGGQDVFVHISAVERAGLSALNEGQHVEFEIVSNGASRRRKISRSSERLVNDQMRTIKPKLEKHFGTIAEWYLTVRCTNAACGRLIAFQKARYPGDDASVRFAVTGLPSVNCPHCKRLVRFRRDQIERRQVLLT